MPKPKQTITKLLIAFADALNAMDDHEFDLLIQGKAKLRLVEEQKTVKESVDYSCFEEAVSELAQTLNNAESREAAGRVLASISQPRKRDFLLLLAKACGVRTGSKDSISTIERKLIENVVGARLRSEAIKKVAF